MKSELVLKIILVLFGLAMGGALSELALKYLHHSRQGSEFENLNDLRAAMLQPEGSTNEGASLKSIVEPNPNDKIIFELRPNLDLKFMRVQVKTNSCGMRDVERSVVKPKDVYRIALLGDSFAFGWGVEIQESFAKVLEANLNRFSGGKPQVQVLNFGVPGYSTFQEVSSFLEKGLDFQPDEVLIFFVDNDFGYPFFVRDINQPGGFLSASEFARLTWKALDPKIEEQRIALQGLDPNSMLKNLSAELKDKGIRISVVINPGKNWESVDQQLWVLRENKGLRKISLMKQVNQIIERRGIDRKDLSLSFDPHPSALKHKIMGDLLTPYFMDRL